MEIFLRLKNQSSHTTKIYNNRTNKKDFRTRFSVGGQHHPSYYAKNCFIINRYAVLYVAGILVHGRDFAPKMGFSAIFGANVEGEAMKEI